MFDKWGKFQYAVMDGNVNNFGDYEGCLRLKHAMAAADIGTITGKHCMIEYTGGGEVDGRNFSLNFDWQEL